MLKVQFHPRDEKEILVTPMRHAAVVVTLTENSQTDKEGEEGTSPSTTEDSKLGCKHKLVPLEDEVGW